MGIGAGHYGEAMPKAHTHTHTHIQAAGSAFRSGLFLVSSLWDTFPAEPHPFRPTRTTCSRVRMHFKVANKSSNTHKTVRPATIKLCQKRIQVEPGTGFFGHQNWTFATQIRDMRGLVGKVFKFSKHTCFESARE